MAKSGSDHHLIQAETGLGLLFRRLRGQAPHTLSPAVLGLDEHQARAGRSVFLRHLDCGSCNGCELQLNALSNPVYDIERFGIRFESSPRHADALVLTGPFTLGLEEAALRTWQAMPDPRVIITVGDCTSEDGSDFSESYAVVPRPRAMEETIVDHVPGCPPSPVVILQHLLSLELPPASSSKST